MKITAKIQKIFSSPDVRRDVAMAKIGNTQIRKARANRLNTVPIRRGVYNLTLCG